MGVILNDKIIEVILSRVNQHKIAAVKNKVTKKQAVNCTERAKHDWADRHLFYKTTDSVKTILICILA